MRDDLLKGRVSLVNHAYLVTTVTDRRRPVFVDFASARLAIRELRMIQDEGWAQSLCWVLMPDHLHWLFQLQDHVSLSECVRRFKGRSARAVNRYRGWGGPLWQRAFYDHALRREEDLMATARYVVANPLRANLVRQIGDYPHWDAVWL